MDAATAIKGNLDMAEMIGMAYLGDLSGTELLQRPHPECHHLNWQVGHLVCSEHQMMETLAPGAMPALPAGFIEKYSKGTADQQDPSKFATKDELMQAYQDQRAGTLAILAKMTPQEMDEPSGIDYAPTKGALLRMQGEHWMMHCGQWVIVRRNCGKPVVI